jgi:hypothetical protein
MTTSRDSIQRHALGPAGGMDVNSPVPASGVRRWSTDERGFYTRPANCDTKK